MFDLLKTYWPYILGVGAFFTGIVGLLNQLFQLRKARYDIEQMRKRMEEDRQLIRIATIEETERYGLQRTVARGRNARIIAGYLLLVLAAPVIITLYEQQLQPSAISSHSAIIGMEPRIALESPQAMHPSPPTKVFPNSPIPDTLSALDIAARNFLSQIDNKGCEYAWSNFAMKGSERSSLYFIEPCKSRRDLLGPVSSRTLVMYEKQHFRDPDVRLLEYNSEFANGSARETIWLVWQDKQWKLFVYKIYIMEVTKK